MLRKYQASQMLSSKEPHPRFLTPAVVPWFVETPLKWTTQSMSNTNWKHAWTLVYFLGAARTCVFRQCVTFYPSNLVRLRFCQHSQGAQVGTICRMQLRPSDVVVSLHILIVLMVLCGITLKICKIWLYDLKWKIWLYNVCYRLHRGATFVLKFVS